MAQARFEPSGVANLLKQGREANRHRLFGWEAECNICQLGPFFVGGPQVETPRDLMSQISNRLSYSASIKGAVRFLDTNNRITLHALEYAFAKWAHDSIIEKLQSAGTIQKHFLFWRAGVTLRQMERYKARCQNRAIDQLREITQNRGKIAVENPDRSFRMAQFDELHELLEAILQAKSYWVFIFKPQTTLLADTLELVADVT